jgi:riboflavin kinase/FMN adenylyltransferase
MAISLLGKVIHGDHYGKKLGFPTANLDRRDYVRRHVRIRLGIWAGYAFVPSRPTMSAAEEEWRDLLKIDPWASTRKRVSARDGITYKAGIVIGPLDKRRLPKIEAHLIGFKGNLYGKKITISLKKYIRPFKKFRNEQELKKQIQSDLKKIIKILS